MLIALNGRLRSGKNVSAERLKKIAQDDVEVFELAFADPLKNSAAALLGVTREDLELMKVDPNVCIYVFVGKYSNTVVELTGRQYLERYGTEAHRDIFGETFWLDQTLPPDFKHDDGLYIVTDCRFPNEAIRVRELGGLVVEVIGPEGREGNGHPSDTPLPDELIDVTVDNSIQNDAFWNLDVQLEQILAGQEVAAP
jgi:hypothetical protein